MKLKKEYIEKFSDGIRFIILLQRGKETERTAENKVCKRKISSGKEEFFKILNEFKDIKEKSNQPLRIYSSVNRRNIEKAIRVFKTRQLEADYYDFESKKQFYLDIENRWFSSIMKPSSKDETLFLIDIDEMNCREKVYEDLKRKEIELVIDYPTKNGWHFITKPFDSRLLPDIQIKKDALMLIDY